MKSADLTTTPIGIQPALFRSDQDGLASAGLSMLVMRIDRNHMCHATIDSSFDSPHAACSRTHDDAAPGNEADISTTY